MEPMPVRIGMMRVADGAMEGANELDALPHRTHGCAYELHALPHRTQWPRE